MSVRDNDRAWLDVEREGWRLRRVMLRLGGEELDITGAVRRVEVVLDVGDAPVVRLELLARARIVDLEPDGPAGHGDIIPGQLTLADEAA